MNNHTKEDVRIALDFATRAHKGQYRRGKDENGKRIEYITHPIQVAKEALEIYDVLLAYTDNYKREFIEIVALLHDTVEDTPITDDTIRSLFGDDVADTVELLTKTGSYTDYIIRIAKSYNKVAKIVKMADLTHNLSTLERDKGSMVDKYKLSKFILLGYI